MNEEHIQKPESPPQPAATNPARSFWKRTPVIVIGTAVLAVLLFLGLDYLVGSFTHESTDDAFLSADVVSLAPKVAGQVLRVAVTDNQQVKAGELLVEIDPRDLEVLASQKKAAGAAAESNVRLLLASIELLRTEVATAEAVARQSRAEADADRATAEKANMDLKRAEDLIAKRIISPQEYDSARAAAAAASATLVAGQEKAASDQSKVAQAEAQLEAGRRAWERALDQAKQSSEDTRQAELNLSYTRVLAPADGRITHRAVVEGDYVQVGQALLALVPAQVWVTGNFKETQLANIRVGQPVKISIDSVAGGPFPGHVQSIQAGSGAAFSLLPPENAVGNFVKVVQRVPVKITFDHSFETSHTLGPGMSVVPSIRVSSFEIPAFAIALAAAILALAAGFWWFWAAARRG